jgi:hypothetical protein
MHLRPLAWVALFALLGMALAPTISKSLFGPKALFGQVEVCTVDGMKLVTLDDQGAPSQPDVHPHSGDCPFCGLQGPAFLPSVDQTPVEVAATTQLLPPRFYRASRPLFAWASARSRAPPFTA